MGYIWATVNTEKKNEVPTLTSSHLMMNGSTSILKNQMTGFAVIHLQIHLFFTLNSLLERIQMNK